MPAVTTVGQLLVNSVLPAEYRDMSRVLDKKELNKLLSTIAREKPDQYPSILKKLGDLGWQIAARSGGYSIGSDDLITSDTVRQNRQQFRQQARQIYKRQDIDTKEKDRLLTELAVDFGDKQRNAVYDAAVESENPAAMQALSGAKGSKMNVAALLGSDMLYSDANLNPLAFPVLRNYSEGLSPLEYWAGGFGARRGVIDPKLATADAGFLSKQLNQIAHRGVVTHEDEEPDNPNVKRPLRGLPTTSDDNDNIGRLLAQDVGGYTRNTVITESVLRDLQKQGIEDMLVRSPIVGGPWDGSLYARDVGMWDRGRLPVIGENPAMMAVQALSEPLSQGSLSSKHLGGVYTGQGNAVSGFKSLNQMIQVPKTYEGGAAHAQEDGVVKRIEPAPAGGHYVYIGDAKHFVPEDQEIGVSTNDEVEAGDILSDGIPNPAEVVRHKGIGEGRRYFVQAFQKAMKNAGLSASKRNVEMLARGLVNHVTMSEEYGDWLPDDVVPYGVFEKQYAPRPDSRTLKPEYAKNQYLEQPVLHYTIGTKVRPSVIKTLQKYGVNEITTNTNPAPFSTEMIRGMSVLQNDPDWMVRMYGAGQKRGILEAVHRGRASNPKGTSFVPALIQGQDFTETTGGQPTSKVTSPLPYLPKNAPKPQRVDLQPDDAFFNV